MKKNFLHIFLIIILIALYLSKGAYAQAPNCGYGNAIFDSVCIYCQTDDLQPNRWTGCSSPVTYNSFCSNSCTYQSHKGTCNFQGVTSCTGSQDACAVTYPQCSTYTPPGDPPGPPATPTPTPCVAPNTPTFNRPPDGVFNPSPDGVNWTDEARATSYRIKVNKDPFTTSNSCANSDGSCKSNSCAADGDRCRDVSVSELSSYSYQDNTKYRVTVNATNGVCTPDKTSGTAENVGHACTPFFNDPTISSPTYNQIVEPGSYTVQWNTLSGAGRYVLAVNDITSAVNNGTTPQSLDCTATGAGEQYANDHCYLINSNSTTGNGTPSEKVVPDLVHNRWYSMKVQAFRCDGWVRESTKSPAVRILACNALSAPGTVGNTSTTVTWSTVSGADGYYVTVNDTTSNANGVVCNSYPTGTGNGAQGPNDLCRKVTGANSTSTNFTFNCSHTYTIKVWAYNECREGPKTQKNLATNWCSGGSSNLECDIQNNDSLHYQWDPAPGTTWLQVSESNALNADGSFVTANVYNDWTASTSVVIHDYPNGTPLQRGIPYYARIKRSAAGSQWIPVVPPPLPTCGPIPTPTLYPTIGIQGYLKRYQKSGPSCTNITPGGLNLSLSVNGSPQGVTTNCSNNGSSYTCNVIFNNQAFSPTPAQSVTLNATSTDGYAPGYWAGTSTSSNSCPANPDTGTTTLNVNAAAGPYDIARDILFKTQGWIKLRNASFAGNSGTILKDIPSSVTAFDADDNCGRFFICPEAGLGTAQSPIPSGFPWSSRNWGMAKTFTKQLTPSRFYDYIKARKNYVTTTLPNLVQDGNGKINVISGNITIDEGNKQQVTGLTLPTVIIVVGHVTISAGQFNEVTDRSIAILATGDLNIVDNGGSGSTQELRGIFFGEHVVFDSSERAVKITGNLVSADAMSFGRERDELTQPSLFIYNQPRYFVDLLPLLSISTYDWRQLQ